ncbi:MAG: hypothetical protein P4M14_11190 [Gammaproteobacteria bacterium]|nr:hypothetical protein [Gammaproteobacteria bacterium]
MLNITDKNYSQLTAKERVNLALAAFSRGDENEISRLKRTCPRKHYTMIDAEYIGSIEGLVWVVTQFSEMCDFSYNKIILCEAYIAMFTFLNEYPQHENDDNLEKFCNAKTEHVSNLKSVYQALSEFCCENKLNYDHVIEWLKISPELASQYDEYLRLEVDSTREFTDYVKQKLFYIWQRYTPN